MLISMKMKNRTRADVESNLILAISIYKELGSVMSKMTERTTELQAVLAAGSGGRGLESRLNC